ncbi:MAG: glycosyltransferase [wastewater metagenome]|nr:glycosyltransferase [Candidatus Loosdrechtia aerotolerans]
MDNQPLISIIMGFLNAGKFIRESIESVFAQTYHNWELLLIDDGSTDTSTKIARQYAKQNPAKVYYLEHNAHQNRGVCASRNLGIRNAKGEFIAILDADDVWLPHKLERQVSILHSQYEAGMVYGAAQYWRSWTGDPEDIQQDFIPESGVQPNTLIKPPALLTRLYPLGSGSAPCPSDLMLRRKVVEDIGGFEESFHGMCQLYEDQAFLAKVYLKEPVFVSNECWSKYRLHPDSCDSVVMKAGQYHSVRKYFLNWLAEYLSNQQIRDVHVWKSLHKALRPYRHPILYSMLNHISYLKGQKKNILKRIMKRILPFPIRNWLRNLRQYRHRPGVGSVRFGDLRRTTPISREFGFDRGLPVDRYYIENFLATYAGDISGRVLEIGDDFYTQKFGGNRVSKRDVLHVTESSPQVTFIGDLTCADHIPSDIFDCIILTQTLHLIYDVRAALKTLYRILKPGGVLLATFPGISQISEDQWGNSWYWGFTTMSAHRLFTEIFPQSGVTVKAYGNVLTAAAFMYGLAAEELKQEEFNHYDPIYQVLITVRAIKSGGIA